MRIGISGVSSTGKTTLAKHLSQVLGIPLLDEGMKDVYARRKNEHLEKFQDLSDNEKATMQMDMVRHRCDKELEMVSFVGDGTPIDCMAFWLEWSSRFIVGGIDWDEKNFRRASLRTDDLLNSALRRYDVIFRLPFGVLPIVDDNRRFTDERFLRKIDYLMTRIADDIICTSAFTAIQLKLPALIQISKITIPDRCEEILGRLHDIGAM